MLRADGLRLESLWYLINRRAAVAKYYRLFGSTLGQERCFIHRPS